ncbi:sulfotransferase [Actinoplanes sp. RD1]|uniref:sulfotransferase n=1 Tax=Actinoplanes sp. RD1 TaxID=3064538 RepID=UPI0027423118|nr:sulfotransferase [Actinoplanes sp. RD1]
MDRAIVISNGRCGSTLLSDLIVDEPETLSAQEFFMSMVPWSRSGEVVSGADYWDFVSSPTPEVSLLVKLGVAPKELRYRGARFGADLTTLPRILTVTLPKATDDPDALYARLESVVPHFPDQTIGAHHRAFLDLTAELTGRKRWVERSGGSSQIAPSLLETYPDAKIVYLTRDWNRTATSMSRHASFQLVQLRIECIGRYGFDPLHASPDEVPAEMRDLMPDRLTADVLRARGEDQRKFLALCAFMSSQAEQALADRPPASGYRIAYEDLLADPVGELTRLGAFLGFADPAGWAAAVAGRVRRPEPVAA